ncbi:Anaphase-promoting complex (APC), subunit 11 [Heracleum sosnowskyi]|uniref:Anaphase-promoting complex (APC), subunit 11 n=1 Tax=Heracleum sosnowskyi TaxID=360622 RepID=A0AAD8HDA5_9APIA|nr:Anaphase-promoting complex (APC), subunit 11 [Heracleum sosnowskyi]
MSDSSPKKIRENQIDSYPLLMEQPEYHESNDHVIDIERHGNASSSSSVPSYSHSSGFNQNEERTSSSPRATITQPPLSTINSTIPSSPSSTRRGEGSGRRQWSPFNTILWISIELAFVLGQIIAAIVVLTLSTHENPQTPLFAWIVGYTVGCIACLPLLYWRYLHRNRAPEQGSTPLRQDSTQSNSQAEPNSFITISVTRSSDEEGSRSNFSRSQNTQRIRVINPRLIAVVDQFKMALDCFFAVWFVVGNVWIFGGNASAADAPNLYRLCIVFLTFSCIGYAMPFILCGMICCCLPCIISILGVREDVNQMRGASEESINALPKHKFQLKRHGSSSSRDTTLGVDEGGIVAAGTEKERRISEEDAVCCICLARYTNNDELRELPCSHFFHTDCVDKWLKINASCPLCKFEIVGSDANSTSAVDPNQQES